MGNKQSIDSDSIKLIMQESETQTLSKDSAITKLCSQTFPTKKEHYKSKNKHQQNKETQTESYNEILSSKLPTKPIRLKGTGGVFSCSKPKRNLKDWPILQSMENYEPLSSILKKISVVDKKTQKTLENETIPISTTPLIWETVVLPKYIMMKNLKFSELLSFIEIKNHDWLTELEIIEVLETSTENFNKGNTQYSYEYRGILNNNFVNVKIFEFDKILSNDVQFEENLLKDLLIEKFILENVKQINDPFICQLVEFGVIKRTITPVNERKYAVIQICEYGKCCLEDLLIQRSKKNEFYKEREIVKHISKLLEGLQKLHQKGIAHQNISTKTLILSEDNKSVKFSHLSNAIFFRNDKQIKRSSNLLSQVFLAPELSIKNYSDNIDPMPNDIYCLGLVILLMMGIKPKEIENIKNSSDHKTKIIKSLHKDYSNLTVIVQEMLEDNPAKRLNSQNLAFKFSQFLQDETKKILLATSIQDEKNELEFLRSHQKDINSKSEKEKLARFEILVKSYRLIENNKKALNFQKFILKQKIELYGKNDVKNKEICSSLDNIGEIAFIEGDYDLALQNFNESLEAKKCQNLDDFLISESYYYVAICYYQLEKYFNAIECIESSLRIKEKLKPDQMNLLLKSRILSWGGLIYYRMAEQEVIKDSQEAFVKLDKSLDYHIISLDIREKQKIAYLIADSLSDIANIYYSRGNLDSAIDFYLRTVDLKRKIYGEKDVELAISLNDLGSVYDDTGEYEKALEYYDESLKIHQNLQNNDREKALILLNIGGIYISKLDPLSSLDYHRECLEIVDKKMDVDDPIIAKAIVGIATSYFIDKQFDKAYHYYCQALLRLKNTQNTDLLATARAESGLGNCYLKMEQQNIDLALQYHHSSLNLLRTHFFNSHQNEIANEYNCLAGIAEIKENYDQALNYYEKAKKIKEKFLKPYHIELAKVLQNISALHLKLGNHELANENLNKSLNISKVCKYDNSPGLEKLINLVGEANKNQSVVLETSQNRKARILEGKEISPKANKTPITRPNFLET